MRKRKIAIVLIFAMIMCMMPVNVVNAEEISGKRTNFNFIETSDLNNIHYTYEENGETYSVYEKCNEDMSIINTEIYLVQGKSKKTNREI